MQVIMVSGRAGEGKTTFTKLCVRILAEHDIMAEIVPFSLGVKETASNMGWDGKKDSRGRKLLQDVGRIGREYDENLWAEQAVEQINADLLDSYSIDFIDDWRFRNEGAVVDKVFDVLKVRIVRPRKFHSLYGTDLYNDLSEVGLPEASNSRNVHFYDHVVYNLIDIDGLQRTAEVFVTEVLLPKL